MPAEAKLNPVRHICGVRKKFRSKGCLNQASLRKCGAEAVALATANKHSVAPLPCPER